MIGDIYIPLYTQLDMVLVFVFSLATKSMNKMMIYKPCQTMGWNGVENRTAVMTGSHEQSFKQIVHHQLHSLLKLVHVLKKLKGCLDCFLSQKLIITPITKFHC